MQALTSDSNKLSKPNNCQQTEIRISVRHNTQLKMTNIAHLNFNLNKIQNKQFRPYYTKVFLCYTAQKPISFLKIP